MTEEKKGPEVEQNPQTQTSPPRVWDAALPQQTSDPRWEAVCAADVRPRARESDWGGWTLTNHLELVYPAYNGGVYPIGLERFTTSSQMLNMIMQVATKTWASDACVAGLVRCLNDLLNPQATLCSGGSNKKTTPEKIRQRLREQRSIT